MAPAVFFDGTSSTRHAVALRFADRLEIMAGEALLARWSYAGIRRLDGPPGTWRLWSAEAPPLARLEVRDAAAQAQVARLCPALDGEGGVRPVAFWRSWA